ncbi:MAG: SDR family oxidoreductase [Phycisphaerae bacterium]
MTTFPQRIFVTGATGYIGGRLVPRLLAEGYRVRCFVRDARKLKERTWASNPLVEIRNGNLDDAESLRDAIRDCGAAYYLVHSMTSAGKHYRDRDRQLAQNFVDAAEKCNVARIIYLGGLGDASDGLSEHLQSRREVEEILASRAPALTVLRAAMIIGSGSASFEILRYLVERLPIMVTPKWVRTKCQPIGVRNVLHYLIACLRVSETTGRTLDIGGPEVMTYEQIMREMERALELRRRWIIPVPVLTPRLSSLWIHLITPLSHRIARPLAEGLRNPVVCRNDDAARLMPQELLTVREAIEAALGKIQRREVETAWSSAGEIPGDPDWAGGTTFEDARSCTVAAPRSVLFRTFCQLGGKRGYFAGSWLWRVRGWMDRLVGGPGLRRGRRDPLEISYGESLDFWRVTSIDENHHLELRAEMKVPGTAVLRFEANSVSQPDHSELKLIAKFKPKGLWGIVYWYAVLPFHGIVFRGMMNGIRGAAEAATEEAGGT